MTQDKIIINKIKEWIYKNALHQITFSNICWDDGDIMITRDCLKCEGHWNQREWDSEILPNFKEEYIYYEDLLKFLNKLENGNN